VFVSVAAAGQFVSLLTWLFSTLYSTLVTWKLQIICTFNDKAYTEVIPQLNLKELFLGW